MISIRSIRAREQDFIIWGEGGLKKVDNLDLLIISKYSIN